MSEKIARLEAENATIKTERDQAREALGRVRSEVGSVAVLLDRVKETVGA